MVDLNISSNIENDVENSLQLTHEKNDDNDDKKPKETAAAAAAASIRGNGRNFSDSLYPLPIGDVTCWKLANSPSSFFKITWLWLLANKSQILSGLTVALAQVPEAISFSFVAGVDPIVGLHSAWIMGICTSLFGGRP